MQSDSPSFWRQVWARPDAAFADVGFASEYVVAGLRLLVALVVLGLLVTLYVEAPGDGSVQLVLAAGLAALLEAFLVYSAVRRNFGRTWIGFVASAMDVTLVSAALLFVGILGPAAVPAMGQVLFSTYFLVLGATSLRYDARICAVTGGTAVVEYAIVVAVTGRAWPGLQGGAGGEWLAGAALLLAASALAATIVVNARRLHVLSISDRLTGLTNRGYFDERMREEGAAAARAGHPVGVIMIDIDHFKRFNDSHGHRAGDEVLRGIARHIRRLFRATDVVARYGGEELALILPGCGAADAMRRLELLRQTVEGLPIADPHGGRPLSVTVSVGFAVWPADGDTLEQVLQRADERLYEAKRLGRNRVCGPGSPGQPFADWPVARA